MDRLAKEAAEETDQKKDLPQVIMMGDNYKDSSERIRKGKMARHFGEIGDRQISLFTIDHK